MNMLSRRLTLSGVCHRIVTAHNAPLRGIARDSYPEVRTREDAVTVLKMLGLSRGKAKIGNDGTILVYKGDVDLAQLGLRELPLRFIEVTGRFECSWNRLRSLVGCPQKAGAVLAHENELESLVGGPEFVRGDYDVSSNKLKRLDSLPRRVLGKFIVSRNPGCPFKLPSQLPASTNFYGG